MSVEKNDDLHEAKRKESSENSLSDTLENVASSIEEDQTSEASQEIDKVQAEIDAKNAKSAEEETSEKRHEFSIPDYSTMSLKVLTDELRKIVTQEKIQTFKKHVESIKLAFDDKCKKFLDQKKEEFIAQGGEATDFRYHMPIKADFDTCYAQYKEKRNQYHKNIEQQLKLNLKTRLDIIDAIKSLINVEENINTTYKNFKALQEQWRKAGPVPRNDYNNIWRTYQHHVEIFYDFLDLNRELRDIDFKKNLEEKQKIITKAEQLVEEEDVHKAFQELQLLHKIWKEDTGPVDREHRESLWEKFSNLTKTIHQKRQDYFKNINHIYEKNLIKKQEIIQEIERIISNPGTSHNEWSAQIKTVETLRESFLNAGRVPLKSKDKNWAAFKEAYRNFNRNKNIFYKSLKKEYQDNLLKKTELLRIAETHKDSDDWKKTTPIMKKIQADWGKIGHVPRKYSNEIWTKFKAACNHYFNRLHEQRNTSEKQQSESIEKKKILLDRLTEYTPTHSESDLDNIKDMVTQWRALSDTTYRKRSLEDKFNKTLDSLFAKIQLDKQQAELIKYGNKLEHLAHDETLLNNEHAFVKRRINEINMEIRQLENNLQFINAKADNPIVKEVTKTIEEHKEELSIWKEKLKKLRSI